MSSPNVRRPQIEHASHHSSSTGSRVSEIAIQADRDGENDEESKPSTEFDFDSPFLFSDATLIVQGRSLHCHRAILSIYSPVFRAMFRNRCIENQKNEVVIPGDSFDDVKEILGHMYTPGGLEMTADSAQRLLPILHRYQIDSMVNMAERTLAFRLTDSTAPMCLKVADMYGLTRLRQAALESCARLDAERLNKVFQEVSLDADLRNEILQKRVSVLEKCLLDIQNSFTHSCTRVESRMERVAANHCSEHGRPMTTIKLVPPPVASRVAISTPTTDGPIEADLGTSRQPDSSQNMQPRMEVSASILPAAAALGNLDMRPLGEGPRLTSSQLNLAAGQPASPAATVGTTVVCEKCADQLKSHIIELCKRGLHKIPIVMLKNS
ncbi:hypothetical protein EG68_03042 [Paragonimus skrjabini miyazakii]|uniref:BTB domain-containing protein n=1 Tax=Paragonimus skrjabini miyazakii TaxID=59628 RepID=A0A8S9YZB3_9TREM|nr:hypothetical protein EG68_03042 [Paragonimus skrjabini miyazakii]